MRIILDYNLGDLVYLKTDNEQSKRIIVQVTISQRGYMYELSCSNNSSWHYDFEFSKNKDILETL